MPVPPNPVKARKHAAERAAREAKRANPPPQIPLDRDEERRRREEAKKESRRQAIAAAESGVDEEAAAAVKKPTRWYMGQYGANDGTIT